MNFALVVVDVVVVAVVLVVCLIPLHFRLAVLLQQLLINDSSLCHCFTINIGCDTSNNIASMLLPPIYMPCFSPSKQDYPFYKFYSGRYC